MHPRQYSGDSEQKQLESLLNQAFHVPPGQSFMDDFPVWDEKNGAKIARFGVFDGARLVASAGVRLAMLKTPIAAQMVAVIGGVVTAEDFRGKGLASQTVTEALSWAKQQGAGGAFLWGSEHNLYGRLGFELYGTQARVSLSQVLLAHRQLATGLRVGRGWRPELIELLSKRSGGFVIESGDEKWLSAHRHVQWRWLERNGKIMAYAAFDRGIDLAGIIHEWGGDRDALLALLAEIAKERDGLELLGSEFLLSQLGVQSAMCEYLCMAKVLDSAKWAGVKNLPLWIWGLDAA